VADVAQQHEVKVALYPHFGFYVATAHDALRLVRATDRANVGVSINLCHELRSGNAAQLDEIVQAAAPYLFLVSINGADHEGDWDRLIQTLDRGDFDVGAFLKQLQAVGYLGPIGLQCYNLKGDQRENLKRSMQAWQKLQQTTHPP
jgi:sugar phosphate isomerase/epimerase